MFALGVALFELVVEVEVLALVLFEPVMEVEVLVLVFSVVLFH